jgi:arylsulfatase A-like enzyme
MSKVGMPGAKQGLSAEDPTIARILKGMGYSTAQFGKNSLHGCTGISGCGLGDQPILVGR